MEQWEDPDFGKKANELSLYGGDRMLQGYPRADTIDWYSMKEIESEAQFFKGGTESDDVVQGGLGDCWFISALSVIATKEFLLKGE